MKERIYVCHTYYHVYVTFLKELNLPKEKHGQATLLLSRMSINFEQLKIRVEGTRLFAQVLEYDEKREDFFPELAVYRQDKGNILFNMLARIRFTRKLADLNASYVPVDFREYKDIYVFCDSDPIGYYLNRKRIYYHAVEDGLNTLVHMNAARYDNRGHFKLKVFLSKKLNLIFIQNGYGKYCLDMEVNDISAIAFPCPYYREVPRQPLVDALTREEKDLILRAFVRDADDLNQKLMQCKKEENKILVLTEPLCSLDVRKRIFQDIVKKYEKEGRIFIKPHPRDALDYREIFPGYPIFDATMPMEMLNFYENVHFDQVITVFTDLKGIHFGDKLVRLGDEFMDQYEDPEKHNHNKRMGIVEKEN